MRAVGGGAGPGSGTGAGAHPGDGSCSGPPESAAIHVLVVDDDAGARTLHSRFVGEAPGFTLVAAVGTGRAAVEHGLHGGVDLVLLDMRLPDISGVEVLHRLRTLGEHSPDVLVISSSQDRVTVRQALAGQVVGYLVKPFTSDALLARLATYRAEHLGRRGADTSPPGSSTREVPLAQGEIDRLLSTGRIGVIARTSPIGTGQRPGVAPGALPKGISRVTLDRVIAALDPVAPTTVVALAANCAISVPTARRYLDHLVEAGAIDLAHRYGKRGRPEVLYRLVPPPEGEGSLPPGS
ncbi:two-component system CitB family response regulator [Leucobacter luti]|uniref:response regulator transcription factor n=1 Tax=Leucobacter luti TaxID=340320 RepID=UPI001046B386|nr:response regulator [Leucobacter luti]MCW2289497.1 two-component system CitB family response regulator [Leucobacter luti]TCK33892.1 two-component system CitB family response regulator [Leucobacter luti]